MGKRREKYSYYIDGEECILTLDEKSLAVSFVKGTNLDKKKEILNAQGTGDNFTFSKEVVPDGYHCISSPTSVIQEVYGSYDQFYEAFVNIEEIRSVKPIFKHGSSKLFVSNKCVVKLKEKRNKKVAENIKKKYQFGTYYEDDTEENSYIFLCDGQEDIFEYIDKLRGDPRIDYIDPCFFVDFSSQIKLQRADQLPGLVANPIDALGLIDAIEARKLVDGIDKVNVAILDSGVDQRHPNLSSSIVDIFDAVKNRSAQGSITDNHGTAVGSLILGINKGGFKGVADGANLFSAKIYDDEIIINEQRVIDRALNWIKTKDIDVLNLSVIFANTNALKRTINDLLNNGRNGKGLIIVAAAGNNSNDVVFPASMEGILTVSACDSNFFPVNDRTKYGWFAPHSNKIDVSAPGVNVFAADISGPAGRFPGDYLLDGFSGTSCSAPLVTGLVALLLAKNNSLTSQEIREIIQRSSQKVGTVKYDPNGHNTFLGHGVINCLNALKDIVAS